MSFYLRIVPIAFVLLNVASQAWASGQIPARTQYIKLTERAGVARVRFPVEVTVRGESESWKDASALRLYRKDKQRTPVPLQVLETTTQTVTSSYSPIAQTFMRIAFLADVPARGTTTYEVQFDASQPVPQFSAYNQLKISGDGMGRTYDTGPVKFETDKESGQLLTFTPSTINNDRPVFKQSVSRAERPFHWNPDVWAPPAAWGHTSDWNKAVAFDATKHKREDAITTENERESPFFFQEWNGPILHRQTRWGRLPFIPQVDVDISYTFTAGMPFVGVQSSLEFREGLQVNAVRNAEMVFSRHQFDTAVWITKDGILHTKPCYDYTNRYKYFREVERMAADVPVIGLVNERKGYGIAYVTLSMSNLNKFTGNAVDEQAHFYIRDYDTHAAKDRNFLYVVRPIVYRADYEPTYVTAGSEYSEKSAILVFNLNNKPGHRYDELRRWKKILTVPLEVVVN